MKPRNSILYFYSMMHVNRDFPVALVTTWGKLSWPIIFCGIRNDEVVWKSQIDYVETKPVYFTHPVQTLSCQRGMWYSRGRCMWFIDWSNLKLNYPTIMVSISRNSLYENWRKNIRWKICYLIDLQRTITQDGHFSNAKQ